MAVKAFFQDNQVSVPLGCRIMAYIRNCLFEPVLARTSADTIKSLKALPKELRAELEIEVYRRILLVHPLFYALHFVEEQVVRDIASSGLHERPLPKSTQLFSKSRHGKHLWFIIFGDMC